MKNIQVYDPPMCCSTGICGTDIDPDLVNFAAMLSQLSTHGVKSERYNLGQQPMAFVQNTAVKMLLDTEGTESLPVIFMDGEVRLKGPFAKMPRRIRASLFARGGEKARQTRGLASLAAGGADRTGRAGASGIIRSPSRIRMITALLTSRRGKVPPHSHIGKSD